MYFVKERQFGITKEPIWTLGSHRKNLASSSIAKYLDEIRLYVLWMWKDNSVKE